MTNEVDSSVAEKALKSSEAAVREAVAEFGAQHPEVLKRLERYVTLLRRAGKTAHADKLDEKAKTLRQLLGPLADAAGASPPAKPVVADSAPVKSPAKPAGPEERPIFNSRGENIAMEFNGHLYTPDGKYLGYWSADMEAYISKDGRYLGQIAERDRMVRDPSWRFRHLTFGRGYEGDRSGWHRVADVERVILPFGMEDVDL